MTTYYFESVTTESLSPRDSSVVIVPGVVLRLGSNGLFIAEPDSNVFCAGSVVSTVDGINVNTPRSTITVGSTGVISSEFIGIVYPTDGPTAHKLINNGLIYGFALSGVYLQSDSSTSSNNVIINSGTINGGDYGIYNGGRGPLLIRNSGTIACSTDTINAASFVDFADAASRVVNTGAMIGDIKLGGGDDVYSGATGTLDRRIYGGAGNDKIITGDDKDTSTAALGSTPSAAATATTTTSSMTPPTAPSRPRMPVPTDCPRPSASTFRPTSPTSRTRR